MLVTGSFPFLRQHVAGKTCSFWPEKRYVFKTLYPMYGTGVAVRWLWTKFFSSGTGFPFSMPVTFLSQRCVLLCREDISSQFLQKVGTRPLNCTGSRPEGFNILIFSSSFFIILILFSALITRNNKIHICILTLIKLEILRRRFSQL